MSSNDPWKRSPGYRTVAAGERLADTRLRVGNLERRPDGVTGLGWEDVANGPFHWEPLNVAETGYWARPHGRAAYAFHWEPNVAQSIAPTRLSWQAETAPRLGERGEWFYHAAAGASSVAIGPVVGRGEGSGNSVSAVVTEDVLPGTSTNPVYLAVMLAKSSATFTSIGTPVVTDTSTLPGSVNSLRPTGFFMINSNGGPLGIALPFWYLMVRGIQRGNALTVTLAGAAADWLGIQLLKLVGPDANNPSGNGTGVGGWNTAFNSVSPNTNPSSFDWRQLSLRLAASSVPG